MPPPIARNRIASVVAKGRAAPKPPNDDKRRRYVIGGIGLLLLVLLLGYWWTRSSSAMEHVREMQHELFSTPRDQMSADERKQKFDDLRAEREKLSENERDALRKEMGKEFQKKRSAEAVAYLHMSQAERMKVIDEKIARDQKRAASGNAGPGGNRPGPGGNGPGAAAPPGGDPATPPKTSSAEERDSRRREMLISVAPEARAGMDQMRIDTATRRVQMGLPPQQPGRPR